MNQSMTQGSLFFARIFKIGMAVKANTDWNMILVRKDKNSPWLIDDQGY
ncbi:DUF4829 domain-containing protein [Pseudobacteroides sp.]